MYHTGGFAPPPHLHPRSRPGQRGRTTISSLRSGEQLNTRCPGTYESLASQVLAHRVPSRTRLGFRVEHRQHRHRLYLPLLAMYAVVLVLLLLVEPPFISSHTVFTRSIHIIMIMFQNYLFILLLIYKKIFNWYRVVPFHWISENERLSFFQPS